MHKVLISLIKKLARLLHDGCKLLIPSRSLTDNKACKCLKLKTVKLACCLHSAPNSLIYGRALSDKVLLNDIDCHYQYFAKCLNLLRIKLAYHLHYI